MIIPPTRLNLVTCARTYCPFHIKLAACVSWADAALLTTKLNMISRACRPTFLGEVSRTNVRADDPQRCKRRAREMLTPLQNLRSPIAIVLYLEGDL